MNKNTIEAKRCLPQTACLGCSGVSKEQNGLLYLVRARATSSCSAFLLSTSLFPTSFVAFQAFNFPVSYLPLNYVSSPPRSRHVPQAAWHLHRPPV
jgi:hypothetical protein